MRSKLSAANVSCRRFFFSSSSSNVVVALLVWALKIVSNKVERCACKRHRMKLDLYASIRFAWGNLHVLSCTQTHTHNICTFSSTSEIIRATVALPHSVHFHSTLHANTKKEVRYYISLCRPAPSVYQVTRYTVVWPFLCTEHRIS